MTPTLSLVPLGTNGFFPTGGRKTMSFLVTGGARPLLLDAGSGLSRLFDPGVRDHLDGHDELEILLTHYHLDHVVGLSYLPAVCRDRRVTLRAPEPPLVDGEPISTLDRLLSPPLFPVSWRDFPGEIDVQAYAGDRLRVAGFEARLRRQRHAGGSVGVVLDDVLAYLTDCEADGESAPFARGARTLVHEVWITDEEEAAGAPRHGHSTVEEVAQVAQEAAVERLIPVHHRPGRSCEEIEGFVARLGELSGVEVLLPVEGVAIPL